MTRAVESYLTEVLQHWHRNRIPGPVLRSMLERRDEVMRFLQQRYPRREARAGDVFCSGSYKKKTDVFPGFDLDLVAPFRHGYRTPLAHLKMQLADDLRERFGGQGVEVSQGKVAVRLRFLVGEHTLDIDVLPAVEQGLNRFSQARKDPGFERKFLLICLSQERGQPCEEINTNLHAQAHAIRKQAHLLRPPIKLLKVWKYHSGFEIGSVYLEMMAIGAFREKEFEGKRRPGQLLRHVLEHMRPQLLADAALQDEGAKRFERRYLGKTAKQELAGIFQEMIEALESNDLSSLRRHFPLQNENTR